jgi:hypothetical protein
MVRKSEFQLIQTTVFNKIKTFFSLLETSNHLTRLPFDTFVTRSKVFIRLIKFRSGVPNLGDASPWGDTRGLKSVIYWVHLYQWGDATDVKGDAATKRLGTPGLDHLSNCVATATDTWSIFKKFQSCDRGVIWQPGYMFETFIN